MEKQKKDSGIDKIVDEWENEKVVLRERVERIAEKYADLVERKLDDALQKGSVSASEFEEIKDGIRMLNHVMSALRQVEGLSLADMYGVEVEIKKREVK